MFEYELSQKDINVLISSFYSRYFASFSLPGAGVELRVLHEHLASLF